MRIISAVMIILIMGCSLLDQGVLYQFIEMQCVDYGWENSSDDEQWADNVQAYLEDEGITVNKIEALNDHGMHCDACGICAKGRSIEVWVAEDDIELIEELGFAAISD